MIDTQQFSSLRGVQELFFVGEKDLNCGRCVDFLWGGVFLKSSDCFGDFLDFGFLGRPIRSFCLGGQIFLRIYRRCFLFLYENKYIISPQNGCINMANMAVIFHGATYGSLSMAQTYPHCFPADFRLGPLGRREAWQTTEPQGTKNMIQSDHLPSRELTYCST